MEQGNIIFLNGISSSGKTVIAKALQEIMDGYYLHTGLDHYAGFVPQKFHVFSNGIEPSSADGALWVIPEGSNELTEIRFGPEGYKILSSSYLAHATLASEGIDLIIDDVIFDKKVLKAAVISFLPFNVLFVGIQCPLDVAIQREKERKDRVQGLAKMQFDLVHSHGIYDLVVDTSQLTPMECANQIKNRLLNGPTPEALRRLKKYFDK